MGWMLVVSEDDQFQRYASRRAGDQPVVGATGPQSACNLMGCIDVESVLVDALDDVGRSFLTVLRNLPATSLSDVEVLVVGPDSIPPGFEPSPDIDSALRRRRGPAIGDRRVKL